MAALALAGCSDDTTAQGPDFAGLTIGQRVYDQTGTSLTAAETGELQQRLTLLRDETGADVIVYVRDLDADPDATLAQVEQLQQSWVAAAGIDQDIAGAILINREPGTDDEARAGIFVGTTFDDGNVPRGEQESIVEDALIPPLREGNVAGSLTAGTERLSSSIRNGPPVSPVGRFADRFGSTWLPWSGLAVSLLGLAGVALLYRGRSKATVTEQPASTRRPDHETDPAVATALVHRRAQARAVPATVLALAAAGAVSIEQEKKPGKFDKGTVQVRLLDRKQVRGEVQEAAWRALTALAHENLVNSKRLKKFAHGAGATKDVVEARLRTNGWLADGTGRPRAGLAGLALLGAVATVGGFVVVSGGAPLMLLAAIPAAVLLVAAVVAALRYPRFSVAGLDAARPWEAYRDGLKKVGKDPEASVDLDASLPDVVAFGLVPTFGKRLDAATSPGSDSTLRAFAAPGGADPAAFPWAAFSGVFVSSGGGGTASGGGAGGGGGASGST